MHPRSMIFSHSPIREGQLEQCAVSICSHANRAANCNPFLAQLLYSEWSSACIINPEYKNLDLFTPLMDIYSTQSLASARVILNQFAAINISIYGEYNATTLNASLPAIKATLQAGYPTGPGYLWATLVAYNATAPTGINGSGSGSQNSPSVSTSSTGNSRTTLAMWALYHYVR
jgi:hypothetical protein